MNTIAPLALLIFSSFTAPVLALAESCKFSLDDPKPTLEWTGYKFTEKSPVKGKFDRVTFGTAEKGDSVSALLASVAFTIDGTSVSTGDAGRNFNIASAFFAKLKGGPHLRGILVPGKEQGNSGQFDLVLWANGAQQKIPMKWELKDGGEFTASGSMDMLRLGWNAAFNSLHQTCKELHRGKDKKTKTWSTVDLSLTGKIKKSCQ